MNILYFKYLIISTERKFFVKLEVGTKKHALILYFLKLVGQYLFDILTYRQKLNIFFSLILKKNRLGFEFDFYILI